MTRRWARGPLRSGADEAQERETRQEALRILYRLRDDCATNEKTPPHVLEAIESLIEDYERETR